MFDGTSRSDDEAVKSSAAAADAVTAPSPTVYVRSDVPTRSPA